VNKIIRTIGIIIVIALIVTVANGFYFLEEGKQAVITQFGRPVGQPVTEAGLHFKTPYIQEATFFEKKILIWDGDPNQIPTNDKTPAGVSLTPLYSCRQSITKSGPRPYWMTLLTVRCATW
jgi:membrane protease subunit HflC